MVSQRKINHSPVPTGLLRDTNRDWTPLYIAIWRQDLSEVLLLANKQSVRVKDDVGYTPLHLACSRSSSLLFTCRQIRDREIAGFGSMAYRDKEHLFKRSDNEDAALQMCRVLLDCGADPNATTSDRYPWTPMHCVASSLWMNVANLLLEHGGSAFSARMCSPYCWALDVDTTETHRRFTAIPGKPATMEELLKAHLSQEQLDAIYAYHKRIQ
jgi:ankyrin repeat protein